MPHIFYETAINEKAVYMSNINEKNKIEDKTEQGVPNVPSDALSYSFKQKIDNFFYHYKFHTIVAVFLTFVIIWTIISSVGKNTEDAYIGYIGDNSYTQEEIQTITQNISSALKHLGDGEDYIIDFRPYNYLSAEQIEEEASRAEALGRDYEYYPVKNEKNFESFMSELQMGDIAVWFVSGEVYERMDKSNLLPIEYILGYVPEGAVDEYALKCSDLDITSVVKRTSNNTYLIMRASREYSAMMGEEEVMRQLERDKALYKAIVEYKK